MHSVSSFQVIGFISYLCVYMNGISPNSFLFSIIIYGLHGINEKPSPVWTIYCVPLFFFYRISPCLICNLAVVKWVLYVALYLLYNEVPFYTMLWNIRRMRNFCCIILCNTRFCYHNPCEFRPNRYFIEKFKTSLLILDNTSNHIAIIHH